MCNCSIIYHITLIVCAPYFVNLNNTFKLKCYYSLFVYVHSKREQKVIFSYQIYSAAILTLRVAIISNVQNVETGRQTTPPLVDGVVHTRLVQFAPHGKVRA